ncbi:hypothetical protein CXG81DRAFT_14251 [Caulochytrium protostelioides]|uniref:Trehalase n=1 Tax=Caulochytrium protostelioides TaxID=1555241 RepID=A0A4P9X3N8_9FUNG|nr:hypothetical protein CXG81DRAFT_14251 [Caulochytrium protostelioides]|eukprot:RKO99631.1 hypothetical protein CXG81DRAFT_14251 [Caulochytrium protostelioides]
MEKDQRRPKLPADAFGDWSSTHPTFSTPPAPRKQRFVPEDELNYFDNDHRHAHGLGDENGLFLSRNRTLSQSAAKLSSGLARFAVHESDIPEETPKQRRRGSHDEKSLAQPRKYLIDVEETQRQILEQEDTDGDFQITIHDAGPKSFQLGSANSGGYRKYEIRGTYMLSNLLQELAWASEYGRKFIVLDEDRLAENPLERLQRLIKFHFWDGLTRRVDADGIEIITVDPKNRNPDQRPRIFVPFHDHEALHYYQQVAKQLPHLDLQVERLPEVITATYVKSINRHPGILSLALRRIADPATGAITVRGAPFVVPGGRFNEMYGWDSYFESLGLLVDGRVELARGMVENFNYQIEHYGKILNANRSYYLTRTQPPFLSDMIIQVAQLLCEKADWGRVRAKTWLYQGVRACVKELLSVWLSKPRLDPIGLSKYYPEGIGMPPETESTHFNHILEPYAKKLGMDVEEYKEKYANDTIHEPELDMYFVHDRAVRESGHDTTYRFEGRCASLATIDLNALVYKYETDLAELATDNFGDWIPVRCRTTFLIFFPTKLFRELSVRTQHLVQQYLWNPERSLYFDYDCTSQRQSVYETVTTLWAMWAGLATPEQAAEMVPVALRLFEAEGGLVSGTEASRGRIGLDRPNRQWDYPYGWAPHQMLAWPALKKYGFVDEARRVAYRWLYTITKSFVDFNGVVPEKFDVVDMTHKVNVEYGNVGADFHFVVKEGFGWMNASFGVGITFMTRRLRRALGALTHPDQLFPNTRCVIR